MSRHLCASYRFVLLLVCYCSTNVGQRASAEKITVSDCGIVSLMQHTIATLPRQELDDQLASETTEASLASTRVAIAGQSSALAAAQRLWSSLWAGPSVPPAHPFPSWNWEEVKTGPLIVCSIVLFISAVLCSAGGIGGGGIYVTVLMVAGHLGPHDAVPLSKAVVFFGSLSSLFLNAKRTLVMQDEGNNATCIDFNVCRLVVPCSLLGTLIGVMVNGLMTSWLIVTMLLCILLAMTYMSFQKFRAKYLQETRHPNGEPPLFPGNKSQGSTSAASEIEKDIAECRIGNTMLRGEGIAVFLLLVFVIVCGVFRQHAENCRNDVSLATKDSDSNVAACMRPVMTTFLGGSLHKWMARPMLGQLLPLLAIAIPACLCIFIAGAYSRTLIKHDGWKPREVFCYTSMALLTGCFAGLVGIGGGLVFSPFMMFMGLPSSVAVATSSTCVIFTSSSTTMQYLFTDRIIMSLALLYGVISSIASYIGTSLVHCLQDHAHARESHISGIVCLGVAASVVLSVYKLCAIGIGH